MFGLSVWHLAVLAVVGMVVFGPERLPGLMRELGKALRQVRQVAAGMQEEIKAELGPEVGDLDLRSLHPRTFVEKHLFGDEEDSLGLHFLRKDAQPPLSLRKPVSASDLSQTGKPLTVPAVVPSPSGHENCDLDAT